MDRLREELDLTRYPGLDFVNTVVPFRTGPIDLLGHPEDFAWWLAQATPPSLQALAPTDPSGRHLLISEARHLREALIALFTAVADGARVLPSQSASTIDRILASARVAHVRNGLTVDAQHEGGHPWAVLVPLTLSAFDVAHGVRPDRLRQCAADACLRWFVDTSKSGRRRWCSMERCGNRAKATRYRRRRAEAE